MSEQEPRYIIGDRKSWPVAPKPGERGPLVRVQISPGRFVKIYKQDALEQGLIEPESEKGDDGEETDTAE